MGLSPSDKQRYKESKRRRRQALLQSETGYIMPYRRSKKPLIIALCVIAAAALLAAGGFAAYRFFSAAKAEETAAVTLTEQQKLQVVNRLHPLTAEDVPPLSEFDGVQVHTAIVDELEKMQKAAAEQGIDLHLTAGYVSFADQQALYEKNLAQFRENPAYTPVRAQAAAQRVVPEAGCCESQTGLLVTFDFTNPRAKAFAERECINYGFILRFPEDKDDFTHIEPNAVQYRYVGAEHAAKMRAFDMCLEEYAEYTNIR